MLQVRKNMFFICVTVGLVLLASKYRNNVLRSVNQICRGIAKKSSNGNKKKEDKKEEHREENNIVDIGRELQVSLDKVILVDSPEKCDYAVQRIRW